MQRIAHLVGASISLAFCAVPALAQTGLFGIGEFGTGFSQNLYTINQATGTAVAIGSTGLTDAIDLAFDPSTSRLIALTQGGDRYSINPLTAQATLIADITDFIPEGGLAINASGTMYTTNFDDLYFASGSSSFTFAGASGLISAYDVSGLALVNNQLFGFAANGTDTDSLVRYDAATGAATIIGTNALTSSDALGGLAWSFMSSDVYATNGSSLFSISTIDGSAQSIGSFGVQGVAGIAYIPAPSVGAAMLASVALIARRRRSRA